MTGYFGNEPSAPLVITQGGGLDVFYRSLNEVITMLRAKNIEADLQTQIQTFIKANADQLIGNAKSSNWFSQAYLDQNSDNAWGLVGLLGLSMGAMITQD